MNLIDLILKETNYRDVENKEKKTFSASMLGSDLRQNWLRYKHGVLPQKEFTQSTLGSVFHKGVEKILENYSDEFKTEYEIEMFDFYKGWSLSGSIDIYDVKNKTIYDIKVTKQRTVKGVLEEKEHHYRYQLNVYRYLMKKLFDIDVKLNLLFILKDGTEYSFRTGTKIPHIQIVEIDPIDDDVIEEKIKEQIDAIEIIEDSGIKPSECEDLWIARLKNGKVIRQKCEFYCSYKDLCDVYQDYRKVTDMNF